MFVLKDFALQIFYRKNVNKMWPEGGFWVCVPTKEGSESRYIDCGPTGSVWVVFWSGIIQVRKEVCAEIPQGKQYYLFNFSNYKNILNILKVKNGLLLNLQNQILK